MTEPIEPRIVILVQLARQVVVKRRAEREQAEARLVVVPKDKAA